MNHGQFGLVGKFAICDQLGENLFSIEIQINDTIEFSSPFLGD